MQVQTSSDVLEAQLRALPSKIDAAGEGATLTLYTGTKPAFGAEVPVDASALVVIPIPYPCEDRIDNGVLYFKPVLGVLATETGVPTWGRIKDADGVVKLDGDAGAPSSDTFFKVQNESGTIYEGGLVSLSVFSIAGE